MDLLFIEIPQVTRSFSSRDETLRKLQNELMDNPEKGVLLARTGGCRKVRVAKEGQGKSGGGRMIYIHFADLSLIVFLLYYDKARQESLSANQEKSLKGLVTVIRNEIRTNRDEYEKNKTKRSRNR